MPRDERRNAFGSSVSNMLRTKSASAWSSTSTKPSASNSLPTDAHPRLVAAARSMFPRSHTFAWPECNGAPPVGTRPATGQGKRSRSRGITRSRRRRPSPASVDAADDRGRNARALAQHELGGAGDLVGDGDHRRAQLVADAVVRAAQVAERGDPGDAERDVGRPLPPRAPERVADDDAGRDAGQLAQPLAERLRRRRPGRAAAGSTVPGPFAFEASTPAEAQTKPCRVRAITSGGRERTTSADSRRITSTCRGSPSSPASSTARGGRLDLVEPDDPALDLRDRLLGDDDDVARLEPARRARRPRPAAGRDRRPPRARECPAGRSPAPRRRSDPVLITCTLAALSGRR